MAGTSPAGVVEVSSKGFRKVIMPSRYVQGRRALDAIGSYVAPLGSRPFVVSGKRAFAAVALRMSASLDAAGTPMVGHDDSVTECTHAKIEAVRSAIQTTGADVVVGSGGGKAVDTAKAAADGVQIPVITVPTQCATNADQMADAVIFTEDHQFVEDHYLTRAPALVLVDTEIVGLAPVEFLVQGMGDAIASGVEKPAYASAMRARGADQLAATAALEINMKCYSTLIAHGAQAKQDSQRKEVTEPLEAVIEAIKLMSGFGFGGGGCAAAHAIHNGLISIPGVAKKHGEIVAYGTLVQMAIEGRPEDEIMCLMRWCEEIGLPTSSTDLGDVDASDLPAAARKACDPADTMSNMPFAVTPEMVVDAMGRVDGLDKRR